MKIAILLNGGQSNIFYAGQNVSGNVRVETKDEIKMRGIRLEVSGTTQSHLIEKVGPFRSRYIYTTTLMDFKTYLTGSDKDSELTVEAGVHTFPLSFVMPNDVPSSFEGKYGFIRYKMRAVVNRIMRLDDSTEIPISVIRTLDLNDEQPEVKGLIVVQEEKPMAGCCVTFCCIKGLPEIELRLNRGGFVPGETIVVSGHVVNKSDTKIKNTSINFIQETEYSLRCSDGSLLENHESRTLAYTKRPQIECGSTDTWNDVSFPVPYVMASRLDGSSVININYFIQVKVDFAKGLCANSEIRQDIVIGHIPLQGDFQFAGPITNQPSSYTSQFQSVTAHHQEESSHSGVHGEGWTQDYSAGSVAKE